MIKTTIAERIKQRRKALRLSVDFVANKLNLDRSTVYRYEANDIENLPIHIIEPLAEILNVSPSYLMGWEDLQSTANTFKYKYFLFSETWRIPINIQDILESENIGEITLPDIIMGKWARNKNIFISKVIGDSMNRILPDKSLIAVKQTNLEDLKDGDIVVFSDNNGYSVKLFYNDKTNNKYIFRPNSFNLLFTDQIVPHQEINKLQIYGKIVTHIVNY